MRYTGTIPQGRGRTYPVLARTYLVRTAPRSGALATITDGFMNERLAPA